MVYKDLKIKQSNNLIMSTENNITNSSEDSTEKCMYNTKLCPFRCSTNVWKEYLPVGIFIASTAGLGYRFYIVKPTFRELLGLSLFSSYISSRNWRPYVNEQIFKQCVDAFVLSVGVAATACITLLP